LTSHQFEQIMRYSRLKFDERQGKQGPSSG